jgi:hypothetical protein
MALMSADARAASNQGPGGPPVLVPGARVVDLRNSSGGLSRYTSIPSGSVFRSQGGTGQACSFSSVYGGIASNGVEYLPGQVVQSERWLFIEGDLVSFGEPNVTDSSANLGPLDQAVRTFGVFCDSEANFLYMISVPASDQMLNPRWALTNMRNELQLERPVVFRNPVVDRWGGLITRYSAWLAIEPSAWRAQRSSVTFWRGWTMYLLARPSGLDFVVRFTPDPAHPSKAFSGTIGCIPTGTTGTADANSFPALPVLPAQSRPGVNGLCRWTPPGPGTVTVQARVRYGITFWANGYTEVQPDYVWTSAVTTFSVGELSAVNTRR